MAKTYRVFVRDWWKYDERGHKVPGPGPQRTLQRGVESEEEARRIAREYNASHDPGPLSRKAEYESE